MSPHIPHIPHAAQSEPIAERAALTNRAFILSNATALAIIIVLSIGYVFTHSISLLGAAGESVADWGMSALGWYGLRIAYKPPDATHRFGHGKLEPLLAFGQAQMLGHCGLIFIVGQPAPLWRARPNQPAVDWRALPHHRVGHHGLLNALSAAGD